MLTAGDDRVCDVCDGISENGPYTINEARGLIPAHPNCRSVFVAAGTMQDAFDPNEPRDEQGRWSAGGGAMHEGHVITPPEGETPRSVPSAFANVPWVLEKCKEQSLTLATIQSAYSSASVRRVQGWRPGVHDGGVSLRAVMA